MLHFYLDYVHFFAPVLFFFNIKLFMFFEIQLALIVCS